MLVARVSVATGISPNELLAAPPEVFRAIIKVLNEQADEMKKRSRR